MGKAVQKAVLATALALVAGGAGASGGDDAADWRDQIIYFAMIDRFDNGDTGNDDQGAGEFDPADSRKFSGGDLAGLRNRLDYIAGLGATALWITPPVANQWWNPRANYGGYHGYWAEDFTRVDAHFGDLQQYRGLADDLHGRGMKLVQDIVLNHTGDFFACTQPGQCIRHDDRRLGPAPLQANDPENPADRALGAYHWTPDITDFGNRQQELTYQLAGLDDLNTDNLAVRRALRRLYADWIERVGVDAFRVDTAFYVPEAYFRDFLHSDDAQAPGISRLHPLVGGKGFHVFGEGFAMDKPMEEVQAQRIDGYMRDGDGPLLPGMLNFPLYGTLGDVFARGRPTAELGWRIESMMRVHANPWLMPTFVDNHDVERFLAGGSEAGLRQALLALMTLPGIPVIYYGTEQGFRAQRDAMFAAGYGSGGRDHFNRDAPLYRYLRDATALRREHRVFSRGTPTVLRTQGGAPGALAWRMDHDGQHALVVFNTAAHPVLLDALPTGLDAGTRLRPLFSLEGQAPALQADPDGQVDLLLPARSGWVWLADGPGVPPAARLETPQLDALPAVPVAGDLLLGGSAPPGAGVQVVVDGDLARSAQLTATAQGRWQTTLRTDRWVDPAVEHRVLAWQGPQMAVSPAQTFRVARSWQLRADLHDPSGDDRGHSGRYRYPQAPGWEASRPGDIQRVRAFTSGGSLRVEVELPVLESVWNATHGFDHVALTFYIGLPGRPGLRVMPLQQGQLPEGLHWNYRLRIGGWSNALTSTLHAGADHEGEGVTPGATLQVDRDARRLTVTLPADALGNPTDLAGASVHVTTWDYDGGYRSLVPEGGGMQFGGGDGKREPLWMDAATLIL